MMTKNADKKREQMQMFCMDDMVPKDHICYHIFRRNLHLGKWHQLWEPISLPYQKSFQVSFIQISINT